MIWRILISLFVAWFLSLFGFGAFVIAGLAEFGIVITMTGYYFIFVTVGLLAWIFRRDRSSITIKKDD